MNGYITSSRLAQIRHLPISVPQTELRANHNLNVGSFTLELGQRADIRTLTLKIVRVLTTGILPVKIYDAYGLCVVGIYAGQSDCTPLVFADSVDSTPRTANPFRKMTLDTPGTYRILVRNLTSNVDLSVAASGSIKLYS